MNYHELEKTQSLFREAILQKRTSPFLLEKIIPAGSLCPEAAIRVYQEGYPARLTDALMETYEATHWILGDEIFLKLAEEFLYVRPSLFYDLNQFGEGFSDWIVSKKLKEFPFIEDLSRFEWLFKMVFDSKKPEILQKEDRDFVISEDSKFCFHPSLKMMRSPYSIYKVWKNKGKPESEVSDWDFSREENLILYKGSSGKIFVDQLENWEFQVLQSLFEGKSLVEALAHHPIEDEKRVIQFFSELRNAEYLLGVQGQMPNRSKTLCQV